MRTIRRCTLHVVAAAAITLVTTSCVLRETSDYVVQPAPPTGVHVTIKLGPSALLKLVSNVVADRGDIDALLRLGGVTTRCGSQPKTREGGDRCAFNILRDMDVSGNLVENAANRLYWSDALNDDEFGDFRNDALAKVKDADNTTCLHATIRNMGDWPIEWRDTNWTTRTKAGDSKCR